MTTLEKEEYQKSAPVKFLEKHFKADGLLDLKAWLTESKMVKQGEPDEHRWYTCYHNVYEVEGRFFTCLDVSHKSEEQCDSDIFFGNEIYDSIEEVYPVEVTKTDYVTTKPQ